MAPIPSPAVAAAAVLAKRMSSGTKTALAHAGSGGTYGGIGVGVVLFIAFVIFAIMYYVLYKDGMFLTSSTRTNWHSFHDIQYILAKLLILFRSNSQEEV